MQAFRQDFKAAVAQNVSPSLGVVRTDKLVAHAQFANELLGPGFGRQPALGPGFEDAAFDADGANAAARSGIENHRFDAGLQQVVGAGKAGNPPARDSYFHVLSLSYGRNSRTIWTTAFTFSTGVSGRMPWPRLKMWPGRVPVRRSRSCTLLRSSGSGANSATGSRLP